MANEFGVGHDVGRGQGQLFSEGQQIAAQESEISRRDSFDSNRAVSPLQPAADAIHLDTSDMTLDQVVHAVLQLYQQVKGKVPSAGRP